MEEAKDGIKNKTASQIKNYILEQQKSLFE